MKGNRQVLIFCITVVATFVLATQMLVSPGPLAASPPQLRATVELSGGNATVEIISASVSKEYECLISDDGEDILISNSDDITADRGSLIRSLVRAAKDRK